MSNLENNLSPTRHQTLKIAVLADLHYLSPALIANTPDYTEHRNSDRKMYNESDAFLRAALKRLAKHTPDVLLIAGDLTKDGERESHEAISKILEDFANKTGAQVFAAPGNHDINNGDAMNFNTPDGNAVPAGRTTPDVFGKLYAPERFGTKDVRRFAPPAGEAGGGLSYAVRPVPGLTLIVMDTLRYSADTTKRGVDEGEVGGTITPALKAWVLDQIRKAKANGDTVIGLGHHGFLPHFSMEPKAMPAYLVQDYETVARDFADAGMDGVFTGHMHANDIQKMTTPEGRTFFDIETGSLICYPAPARLVTLTRQTGLGGLTETYGVHTLSHTATDVFLNPLTGEKERIADMTEASRANGFDTVMLETAAVHNLRKFIHRLKTHSEERSELHVKIAQGLNGLLTKRLCIQDKAIQKAGIHVSVIPQGLRETLDAVLPKLLEMDDDARDALLARTVGAMSHVVVTPEGKTILDFTNYIYQRHLGGEENAEPAAWALQTRDFLAAGGLIDAFIQIWTECALSFSSDLSRTLSVSDVFGTAGIRKDLSLVPVPGRTPLLNLSARHGGALILAVLKWLVPGLFEKGAKRGGTLCFRPDCTFADLTRDLTHHPLIRFAANRRKKRRSQPAEPLDPALPFALPPEIEKGLRQAKAQATQFVTKFADSMGHDASGIQDNEIHFNIHWRDAEGDNPLSFQTS
jgi:hypothetical protein